MSNPFENILPKLMLLSAVCSFPAERNMAQCVSTGIKNPISATTISLAGSGYTFSPTANITSSDNIMSAANALLAIGSTHTNYLKAHNFNFSIPATAVICGIEVRVERSASNLSILGLLESYVVDNAAKMVKNGTILTTNKSTTAHWAGTKTTIIYGSSTDLWGTSWLPSDINDVNFGFVFSAYLHGFISGLVNVFPSAQVDNINITIYYNDQTLLPIRLFDFSVSAGTNNTVLASWRIADAGYLPQQELQRSKDGIYWQAVPGNTSSDHNNYQATDNNPFSGKSYYRVMLSSASGEHSYSDSRSVVINDQQKIVAYPNPCTGVISISGVQQPQQVYLLDHTGRQLAVTQQSSGHEVRLDLTALKAGTYILVADGRRMKLVKQ